MTKGKTIWIVASAMALTLTQANAEGFFTSLKGGMNFADQGLDDGWQIDGAIGYAFGLGGEGSDFDLRLEFNPGFLQNKAGNRDLNVGRFMGNAILDVPILDWAYIYGGGGAGGAYYDLETIDNDFTFAFQGMAGVGVALSDSFKIEVGYRYFSSLDPKLAGVTVTAPNYQAVEAGIRFDF